MTNIFVIENKISAVKKYLKILERYKKYNLAEIKANIDIQGALERYLQLVVQASLDLAESLIAQKNFRKPTTLSENFYILNEEHLIDGHLANELIKMAGFRNIIVHDYEEIDYEIVYDILHHKISDIIKFIEIVEKIK